MKTSSAGPTRERDAGRRTQSNMACQHRSRFDSVTIADQPAAKSNNLLVSVAQAAETYTTFPSAQGTQVYGAEKAARRGPMGDVPHLLPMYIRSLFVPCHPRGRFCLSLHDPLHQPGLPLST